MKEVYHDFLLPKVGESLFVKSGEYLLVDDRIFLFSSLYLTLSKKDDGDIRAAYFTKNPALRCVDVITLPKNGGRLNVHGKVIDIAVLDAGFRVAKHDELHPENNISL